MAEGRFNSDTGDGFHSQRGQASIRKIIASRQTQKQQLSRHDRARGGLSALILAAAASLFAPSVSAAPNTFASQVLADNPIGYWRFAESPGAATASDSSGRGSNGSYSGGITLGQPGFHDGDTAALFDGTSGRVVVPNSTLLNPKHITMEAKIRWEGPNGFQQRIFEKSSFEELAQYGLSILDDGHVQVEIRTTTSGTTSVNAQSGSLVAGGVETHVVATFDGNTIRIYLNGILDNETPAGSNAGDISPKPPPAAGSDLGIGNQSVRNRPFKGLIDEAVLYKSALSADRISAHYQSQSATSTMFQYAVKFVCGKSAGRVVAPGTYFTGINVHNPGTKTAVFRKKFAVSVPGETPGLPGETPGPISKFFDAKLGPDEAFEIDCPDILRKVGTNAGFLKGFAVIETPQELDIVAVYTAAGATERVETMELERVTPRRETAEGKPDLVPIPDAQGNFCRRRDLKLTVTVKNQGSAGAPASTTTVDFGALGSASQPTPPLAPGASVDLAFDIPAGCFRPDCDFKITVDAGTVVDESNEVNNSATGRCLG